MSTFQFSIILIMVVAVWSGAIPIDDPQTSTDQSPEQARTIDGPSNSPVVESSKMVQTNDHHSGFKFAWELPNYRERYRHLERRPWLEPNGVFEFYTSLQRKREEDDQDSYIAIGYTALRPFALDFDDFSLAFGVSYLGRYIVSDDINKLRPVSISGSPGTAWADEVEVEGYQNAINFSLLASFPEIGFQFIFDIGYGTAYTKETIELIDVQLNNRLASAAYDRYRYKQLDEGIFISFAFLKSFDRDFLDFISIFMYTGLRTKNRRRISQAYLRARMGRSPQVNAGKHDLPTRIGRIPFADPQSAGNFGLNLFSISATVRIYTIPIYKHRGISFALYGAAEHITGELVGEDFYGLRLKIGGMVTLFDAISVRCNYVNEDGNDQEDAWEVALNIRVSGIVRAIAQGF